MSSKYLVIDFKFLERWDIDSRNKSEYGKLHLVSSLLYWLKTHF